MGTNRAAWNRVNKQRKMTETERGFTCPHGCTNIHGHLIHWETMEDVEEHVRVEHDSGLLARRFFDDIDIAERLAAFPLH